MHPRFPLALTAVAGLVLALAVPTTAPAAAVSPTLGVEFSASVPSDVQRDEGEPEVSVDPGGNVFTCGPSGFSNIADYAQVSRDGGDQFHILGAPPRGQISAGEGGGDCGLASAPVKNQLGQYTWAYTGLGPLTNFSTGTAEDTGQTLHAGPISESLPGVDRQWLVFTDAKTVFLNYNQLATGFVVQKSTDGGFSYGPQKVIVGSGGGRIGPMRAILNADPAKAVVYFPYNAGNKVSLAMSQDGGTNWSTCVVGNAEVSPLAGFLVADHDKAGNIFVAYSEKGGGRDTYVMPVRADKTAACKDGATVGTGTKILINRGGTKTTVMPWVVASGLPGRFAVAYYGTSSDGDPDKGNFKAAWYVHVGMTLDAFAPRPEVAQIQATSHPMHYDSICLGGLGCNVAMGDRSLSDYFAMDMNPADGRLNIVYNNAAKKPGEAQGHVANAVVVTQMSGPSLLGGILEPKRPRLRQTSSDPAGDALSPYGTLCTAPPAVPCPAPGSANQPSMDFVDRSGHAAVEIQPEIDLKTGDLVPNGGFTVTLRITNLSANAKAAAALSAGGSSNIYLFRWNNGYQPAGVTARWSALTGWTYAFDNYRVASTQAGQADPTAEKIVVYPGTTTIPGTVNEDGPGVIRMSVPRGLLKTLGAPDATGRPAEVAAGDGAVFTSAVAYSLINIAPDARAQSYFYPVDNAPAMDFQLGAAPLPAGKPPVTRPPGSTGGGNPGSTPAGGGSTPVTGGLGAPALALAVLCLGTLLWRSRRAANAHGRRSA